MDGHSQAQAHKIITNLLSQTTHRPEPNDIASPPPAYSFRQEQDDEEPEDDGDSTLSPITIHISTPLTITGTSNILLLPPSTTTTATAIALSVLHALKKSTVGEIGIPMIDEDGRPRPIDVKIEAGVRIEGTGNVVGEKGALEGLRRVMREKAEERAREMEGLRGRGGGGSGSGGDGRKRRASSAPVGEREEKRGRTA